MTKPLPAGIQITGTVSPAVEEVLTADALQFVADLHRTFNPRRVELLKRRIERQKEFDRGVVPGFLPETAELRGDILKKLAACSGAAAAPANAAAPASANTQAAG